MYLRYAERQGWKAEILDSAMTGLGGYKDATVAVKSRGGHAGPGVWSRLKYEGCVHRVQRVPVTESQQEADAQAAAQRRDQVRTVDRSERIRTYNFPENRIADHRIGYKAYNLDQVLDGDLDGVISALTEADMTERTNGEAGGRERAR